MAYVMNYDDKTNLYFAANGKISEWGASLEKTHSTLNSFVEMNSLMGASADCLKTYIKEVHFPIIFSIGELFQEYFSRYVLYKDGYYIKVDPHNHTLLNEDTITGLQEFFKTSELDFSTCSDDATSAANKVSDLVGGLPPSDDVFASYTQIKYLLSQLATDIDNHESKHLGEDFVHLPEIIFKLKAFIAEQMNREMGDVEYYVAGSVKESEKFAELSMVLGQANFARQELLKAVEAAVAREQERFGVLEVEWAQQREEQGWLTLTISALVVVGGIVCIVATGGLAAPLVAAGFGAVVGTVTAIGVVAGVATIAYGVSNCVEAGQDILYGSQGDYYSDAWNPLRDTVFLGNQAAYDAFGTVAIVTSSVFSLGGGLLNAGLIAHTASTSVLRALGVFSLKTIVTVGAAAIGGWAGKEAALYFGASETIATLMGLLTGTAVGILVGVGAEALDRKLNLSGFYKQKMHVTNPENASNPDAPKAELEPDYSQAENGGYTTKDDGTPNKDTLVPQKGDVLDRYGETDGRYTSPPDADGNPYSYESRSMPFGENPHARHTYEVTRDFSELADAINNLPQSELRTKVWETIHEYYGGDPNKIKIYTGTASSVYEGANGTNPGSATQVEFPILVEYLMEMGFLKDVTPFTPWIPSIPVAANAGSGANAATNPFENFDVPVVNPFDF